MSPYSRRNCFLVRQQLQKVAALLAIYRPMRQPNPLHVWAPAVGLGRDSSRGCRDILEMTEVRPTAVDCAYDVVGIRHGKLGERGCRACRAIVVPPPPAAPRVAGILQR